MSKEFLCAVASLNVCLTHAHTQTDKYTVHLCAYLRILPNSHSLSLSMCNVSTKYNDQHKMCQCCKSPM